MPQDTERNKQTAMAFYDLMFNQCLPREAIAMYAGEVYIQHNAHVADGKEAFIAYFNRMGAEYPGKKVEFKRAVAEGDMVVPLSSTLADLQGQRLGWNRHLPL